jgi:hypothetical protein
MGQLARHWRQKSAMQSKCPTIIIALPIYRRSKPLTEQSGAFFRTDPQSPIVFATPMGWRGSKRDRRGFLLFDDLPVLNRPETPPMDAWAQRNP